MFDLKKSEKKGFQIIPEGEVVLTILAVEYKKALGRMVVTLADSAGIKHNERFVFVKNDGSTNQVGIDRFWWLAESAFNNPGLSSNGFDESELIGKRVLVTVTHKREPAYNDPSKIYTNVYIGNFKPVEDDVDPLDDL